MRNKKTVSQFLLFIVVVGLLVLSIFFGENPLWISIGMITIAILFFLTRFENRKVEARELVILAVLAAIAAVGRLPFAALPSVQPTTFVIIISGIVFGAESGVMIGVVAALASNMLLGQGPWTPWQMAAWGLVGFTSGILGKTKFLHSTGGRLIFGIAWGFLFGWIMNLWGLLGMNQMGMMFELNDIIAYYAASFFFDLAHSVSNVFFLLIFGSSWIKNLTRFKRKYGLLE